MKIAKIQSSKYNALIAAEKVFKELDSPKPLKYHALATLAGTQGWTHNGPKPKEQIMYHALRDSINEGDNRFKFHGRGFFSLSEHNITQADIPQYASINRYGRKKRQEILEKDSSFEKTCGNCHFIKFTGIKEVTMESGICSNKFSSRCNVKISSEPCKLWELCSEKKIQKQNERKIELTITLDMIKQKRVYRPRRNKINE